MDGKKVLIPLRYNTECTIHAPDSPCCQQSNVRTRISRFDDVQAVLGSALTGGCTSWSLLVSKLENSQQMLMVQRTRRRLLCRIWQRWEKYGHQLKQINLDSTWFRAAERQMLIFSIAAHFRKINDRSSMKNGMKLSEERYPPGKLTRLSF
ncbi:hypothetical protein T08_14480 [Trichinella sp. T8]|nr:hypothetical protein T08_14480 [Trichinella sp. T8]